MDGHRSQNPAYRSARPPPVAGELDRLGGRRCPDDRQRDLDAAVPPGPRGHGDLEAELSGGCPTQAAELLGASLVVDVDRLEVVPVALERLPDSHLAQFIVKRVARHGGRLRAATPRRPVFSSLGAALRNLVPTGHRSLVLITYGAADLQNRAMHPATRVLDTYAADGSEPGGALCVIRDGAIEVEHHVGTRDGTTPWDAETLVMAYSVAKPFASLTLLTAVADGALGLDQRVAELWPEYAAAGKEATTVRQVLSHSAGLASFPEAAADLPYDDREALVALLAAAAPEHEPGTAVAEHALTYGHLVDEILRRATGEDLAERFAGIAAQHGWDLHLRVSPADF